jgi:hypothetical protein
MCEPERSVNLAWPLAVVAAAGVVGSVAAAVVRGLPVVLIAVYAVAGVLIGVLVAVLRTGQPGCRNSAYKISTKATPAVLPAPPLAIEAPKAVRVVTGEHADERIRLWAPLPGMLASELPGPASPATAGRLRPGAARVCRDDAPVVQRPA